MSIFDKFLKGEFPKAYELYSGGINSGKRTMQDLLTMDKIKGMLFKKDKKTPRQAVVLIPFKGGFGIATTTITKANSIIKKKK